MIAIKLSFYKMAMKPFLFIIYLLIQINNNKKLHTILRAYEY